MRWRSRDRTSQLRSDTRRKNGLVVTEVVVLDDTYTPKVDCIDKSWDRATGISPGERYGVAKANVVKEEIQNGGAFKECIDASIDNNELEWRGYSSFNITYSSRAI